MIFKKLAIPLLTLIITATICGAVAARADTSFTSFSVSEAIDMLSGELLAGASTLVRTRHSVSMTFHATGLEPGATYTAWWVIFNRPERCSDNVCGDDDVFDDPEPPKTSVLWASGLIAGQDGSGNFSATLRRDHPDGEVLFGAGLRNTQRAEVHVVLRTHGAPIPGRTGEQISTFAGGCDINVCQDEQAAVHPAH
jgi:hypothetical protein